MVVVMPLYMLHMYTITPKNIATLTTAMFLLASGVFLVHI